MTVQKYTSAGTSLNQIPALHKNLVQKKWINGGLNFDNGAGKFLKATEFLKEYGVQNVRFDPYNLPQEVNNQVGKYIGKCDTSTCANVLNVVAEESQQVEIIKKSYEMLKEGGKLYIMVYEGNKSGIGKMSKKDCWQNNKRTSEYIPVVQKVFPRVIRKGKIIIAVK